MLETFNEDFKYTRLSDDEIKQRGILGRLVGPIADTKRPTRNGRGYGKELWEKVFNSPLMKEKLENRCLFSELGHPTDRTEIDMEKVCACMAEKPKVGSDGLLYGVFDILPTNNGKILKVLCDYGTRIGVSSRGNGDVIEDFNGNETVDPETYECECWDFVVIPAVEAARMTYVTESLGTKKTLQESLNEVIDKATDEDKKVMQETLDNLNIHYTEKGSEDNIKVANESTEAINEGADVIKELQQALKENKSLSETVSELQEKLSVCYAKESEIEDKEQRYKDAVSRLTSSSNLSESLKKRVSLLSEKVKTKQDELNSKEETVKSLTEELNKVKQQRAGIKHLMEERVSEKDKEILSLRERIKSLTESVNSEKQNADKEVSRLQENLEKERKDSANKLSEYDGRISKYKALVEKYRTVAKAAVDKYIDCQANMLGVTSAEIKNRLNEGYSFNDIDRVCKDLQTYTVNMSKLPFNTIQEKSIRMKVTESKEPIKPVNGVDDEVDDSLKGLAGLN